MKYVGERWVRGNDDSNKLGKAEPNHKQYTEVE